MNRRALLGLVAGGLGSVAGCSGSERETPTRTTPSVSVPRLAVEADETPSEEQVRWTVSVEDQFSMETTARVEIQFTNEADQRRTFEFGAVAPFSELRGSGPTSLTLIPNVDGLSVIDENEDGEFVLVPDPPGENCWQAEDRPILPEVLASPTVEPDETLSETYEVVAAPNASGCLPSGSYRFSQTVDEVVGEDETRALSRWGFTLTVSRP